MDIPKSYTGSIKLVTFLCEMFSEKWVTCFFYFHSSYGFQGTEKNTYDLSQPGTPLTTFTTGSIYKTLFNTGL